MPPVKDMQAIAAKWKRQSAASQESYLDGVRNPRKDWATETVAAEPRYKTAVTAAANAGHFGRGVKNSGTSNWQRNAIEKGPARWSQGIDLAEDKFSTGFEPYRRVIETTVLPEKLPKGSPGNITRVAVLAKALHEEKQKRLTGAR